MRLSTEYINQEIAKHVMGWEVDYKGFHYCTDDKDSLLEISKWNPAEDISDALQVFEKLRSSHKWCCLNITSDYDYMWCLNLIPAERDITNEDEHRPTISSQSTNLPRAICLLALKSININDGGL